MNSSLYEEKCYAQENMLDMV